MTRCARYHKQHDAQTGLDAIDAGPQHNCYPNSETVTQTLGASLFAHGTAHVPTNIIGDTP